MFIKRLASGAVLLILAAVFVWQGGPLFLAGVAVISLRGLYELYRAIGLERRLLGMTGYAAAVLYYVLLYTGSERRLVLFAGIFLIVVMGIYACTYPKYRVEQVSVAFMGFFYVPVLLSFLYRIRSMPYGLVAVLLVFISSWGCDTSAYCAGMLFGRHRLAPVLSPKKTVEGAIGGVAGSMLLALLFGVLLGGYMTDLARPVTACVLSCGAAAVISQIGDLAASAIKRDHGIKDYGHLIPGHGGIMDRFDSMLFTAPAIYLMLTIF